MADFPGIHPESGMPSPARGGVGMLMNMLTRRVVRRESMPPLDRARNICHTRPRKMLRVGRRGGRVGVYTLVSRCTLIDRLGGMLTLA